jgi:Na+-translocating ferredoxin:NAD+ oxidoreductase subunit E
MHMAMGLATTFVLVCSSLLVSLLRHWIPKQVRIASYIVIIATFVTIVDYAIQAISLELYAALGAFIQLIVANCVILGRAEAYASKQRLPDDARQQSRHGRGLHPGAAGCLGTVREDAGQRHASSACSLFSRGLPALDRDDPASGRFLRARGSGCCCSTGCVKRKVRRARAILGSDPSDAR